MGYLTILVIDDHDATRSALCAFFKRAGHLVLLADGHASAVAQMTACKIDLVISDIGMPEMSGWDLLPKLIKLQPEIKSIALSGYAYAADIERSRIAGFTTHLKKPASAEAIAAEIERLFAQ